VKKSNPICEKYLKKSKMFEINIDELLTEPSNVSLNSPIKETNDTKVTITPEDDDKDSASAANENQSTTEDNKADSSNPTSDDKSILSGKDQPQTLSANAASTNKKPPIMTDGKSDEDKEDEEEKEIVEPMNITLDSLIDQLNNISIVDDDHLPTRVLLGQLYYQTKNYELAEYWLQRSVKNNKNRGANGGKSGETTYFGGVTGSWGWEGWHWLGMCYNESNMGKEGQAIQCLQYAVDLEHRSQSRGFECLSKICPL